jgi:predicted MFS family arabinose efflux permease
MTALAIWFGLRGPPQPSFPPTESDSTVFIDWRIPGTWRFWSLALPFSLALSAQVGLMVHLVSLLLPHIGADGATTGLAVTSIAAMSGRLALATIVDRLPQRLASAVSFTTQAGALSLIFLFPDQAAALYAGCIVFGLSVGNVITFPALIVQQEFPACPLRPVIGLNTAVCQFTFALAPAFFEIIRDVTGGYSAVLLVCIALELGAAVVILGVRFANTSTA